MNKKFKVPSLKLKVDNHQFLTTNILLILLLLFFSSCSSVKHTTSQHPISFTSTATDSVKDSIIKYITKRYPQFEWLSAKASATGSTDDQSLSFNIHLRIRKDSAIWISATVPPGFEGIRMLLSPDTAKFMDRIHNRYYVGPFDYLDTLLKAHFNFDMLQAILTTNFSTFFSTQNSLNVDSVKNTGPYYRISFIRPIVDSSPDYQWVLHFFNASFSAKDLLIKERLPLGREIMVKYENMQEVNGQSFPSQLNMQLIAEKKANLSLSFDKMEIDKPLEFPFKIPGNYKPIQ